LDRLEQINCKATLKKNHQEDLKTLREMFPLYGLKNVLDKLHKNEEVTDEEMDKVVIFVDSFSTVSLHPAIVGSIVAEIVKRVNQHHHTQTCRKYKTICRFNMPKLPSYETLIARPPSGNLSEEVKQSLREKYDAIIKDVRKVLDDEEVMKAIFVEYPKEKEETKAEADEGRHHRINAVLEKAGLISQEE
jgi:hypothetical protein